MNQIKQFGKNETYRKESIEKNPLKQSYSQISNNVSASNNKSSFKKENSNNAIKSIPTQNEIGHTFLNYWNPQSDKLPGTTKNRNSEIIPVYESNHAKAPNININCVQTQTSSNNILNSNLNAVNLKRFNVIKEAKNLNSIENNCELAKLNSNTNLNLLNTSSRNVTGGNINIKIPVNSNSNFRTNSTNFRKDFKDFKYQYSSQISSRLDTTKLENDVKDKNSLSDFSKRFAVSNFYQLNTNTRTKTKTNTNELSITNSKNNLNKIISPDFNKSNRIINNRKENEISNEFYNQDILPTKSNIAISRPIQINSNQPQISININNYNVNHINFHSNSNANKNRMSESSEAVVTTQGIPEITSNQSGSNKHITPANSLRNSNQKNPGKNSIRLGDLLEKINSEKNTEKHQRIFFHNIGASNIEANSNVLIDALNSSNKPRKLKIINRIDKSKLLVIDKEANNDGKHLSINKLSNMPADFYIDEIRNAKVFKKSNPDTKHERATDYNKSVESQVDNKRIETIIDGNNDSFINELADLLNNVVEEKKDKISHNQKSESNPHNKLPVDKHKSIENEKENSITKLFNGNKKIPINENQLMENLFASYENDERDASRSRKNDDDLYVQSKKGKNAYNNNYNNYKNIKGSNFNDDRDDKNNENESEETPDPRINFHELQLVNSKRPQTSYGGMSARQKSLQRNLQQTSELNRLAEVKNLNMINEELFPMPHDALEFINFHNSNKNIYEGDDDNILFNLENFY